jgi:hypothetical protein
MKKTDKVLVARLWELYPWPERNLPMREMTVEKLLRYRGQRCRVVDGRVNGRDQGAAALKDP